MKKLLRKGWYKMSPIEPYAERINDSKNPTSWTIPVATRGLMVDILIWNGLEIRIRQRPFVT
ncbi:MAG: hypothetical protein ABIK67_05375 [candidate division WOR-3 bacterium]